MILDNYSLEIWLKNQFDSEEGEPTLYTNYITLKTYLVDKYRDVTIAATLTELLMKAANGEAIDFNKMILLNDHGIEHINTVIKRASQLIDNEGIILNTREVYYLLCGILLHDLGNFNGRFEHEKRAFDVLTKEAAILVSKDTFERRYILAIAASHGGKTKNGSKATISPLKDRVTLFDTEIRLKLVASILRFADELADDSKRANRELLVNDKLPKGSEIFHAYSYCLDTVKLNHEVHQVELHFKIPKSFMQRTLGKYNEKKDIIEDQYLLDEIYQRVTKMNVERAYCSSYWKKSIDIESIWVQIEFYSDLSEDWQESVHDDITFQVPGESYPAHEQDFFEMCPHLKYFDGSLINGVNACKKIDSANVPH